MGSQIVLKKEKVPKTEDILQLITEVIHFQNKINVKYTINIWYQQILEIYSQLKLTKDFFSQLDYNLEYIQTQ